MSRLRELFQKWVLRYIKYSIIGTAVFLLNIALYYLVLFPVFGRNACIIFSIIGGIIEFTLISYFNRTRRGIMFESCTSLSNK
jgi:hypothetical protein